MLTQKNVHKFIAALFIIAMNCKQPECMSADEQIDRMWYNCTMEYYSAIKSNEALMHVTT